MSNQHPGSGEPVDPETGSDASEDGAIPPSPPARRRGDIDSGGSLGVGRPVEHNAPASQAEPPAAPQDAPAAGVPNQPRPGSDDSDVAGWTNLTPSGRSTFGAPPPSQAGEPPPGSGGAQPPTGGPQPAQPPTGGSQQPPGPGGQPGGFRGPAQQPPQAPAPSQGQPGQHQPGQGQQGQGPGQVPGQGQPGQGQPGQGQPATPPTQATAGSAGLSRSEGDPAGPQQSPQPTQPPARQDRPEAPLPTGSAKRTAEQEDNLFDSLTDTRKPIPRRGVQGLLYRLIRVNAGLSKRDRQDLEVRQRLNRQLRRTRGFCGYVGIASEKGGVGKTTIAALLAAELAEGRRESVGVADLNPDLGTLPDRYGLKPHYSIRDLLAHVDEIPWRYHVHDFMDKVPEMNVRILAASTDRKIRHQLSKSDVELLAEMFAPFFSFAILDNGTHITHEAMLGTLNMAHALVLVTDNTRDGANLARKTLQFLTDNGFPDIRRRAILAVVAKETASPIKTKAIDKAFRDHVRELVIVPYDAALDGGGPIPFHDPNAMNKLLRPSTRAAVRRLAAIVIDDLVG